MIGGKKALEELRKQVVALQELVRELKDRTKDEHKAWLDGFKTGFMAGYRFYEELIKSARQEEKPR